MASTKYIYSVSGDTASGSVDAARLKDEIHESEILIAVDYIATDGDILDVWMKDGLSQDSPDDVAKLAVVVAAHDGTPLNLSDTVALAGNPKSLDGDLHVVTENFAHVSGNEGINWFIEKELEDGESYSETLVLPAGRHATLNLLRGGSDRVSSQLKLEWFEEIAPDEFMRINPWVRGREIVAARLNGFHAAGSTLLTMYNDDNEVNYMRKKYYCITDGETAFHAKVASKDPDNSQITMEEGLPVDLNDGAMFALTDRPIGRIGNQIASDSLVWVSPPNGFIGNGKNYFKLTMENEDERKIAIITATLNGWHTDANGGD